MIYLELFLTFFKIGIFSFGGGYAMLPMITQEVVERKGWLTAESFLNIIGISQATPGPIAVNSATYVGFTTAGVLGSFFATLGVVMPSVLIIYIIARLFMKHKDGATVQEVLKFIRLGAVGLIAAAALSLAGDVFVSATSIVLFIAAFLLQWRFKVDPILMIVLAGVAGLLLF